MKVSHKVDYALKALLDLAAHSPGANPVRSAQIARRTQVPEKFLEAILVDLRKAGLVESRRGPEGGHRLARPAREITLGAIREAVDGPLSLAARSGAGSVGPEEAALHSTWAEVERAIGAILDGVTLEALYRRAEVHRGAPDFAI